jgi:hypothetical protein
MDLVSLNLRGGMNPMAPIMRLKLPMVNSISSLPSSSELLLAKSEKSIEFMIPTPRLPTVGAN